MMAAKQIGTLNEKPLHAALKEWYAEPGDQMESAIDGYVIDIVRDNLLIEIQTGSFASIKPKLQQLVPHYPVRLVYPIAQEKWIIKSNATGKPASRRKSPKRGSFADLFVQLVSFPQLLAENHFALHVLLIQEEELRRHEQGRRWRRRGWVTEERRLLRVVDDCLFRGTDDVARLIPPALADPFTTADLAQAIYKPRWLAQKMAYCLREVGVIAPVGKRDRSILYTRAFT